MQLRLPATTTRHDLVQLSGGLDLLTPILKARPGSLRDALNFEQSVTGGYTRIAGYERFSGRAAPSAAVYFTITATLTVPLVAGDTITGETSGATGTVLGVDTSSGASVIAYTQATGAFTIGENITNGGLVGVVVDVGGSGADAEYDVTQKALAADVYRGAIGAVPGSGPVRGGFVYAGNTFAFRDNAGGTALDLYRASPSGWVAVPHGHEVAFTGGSSEYTAGETLTQGGVNATVRAVSTQSGSWLGGTAAGRLIIDAPTGGNFAAGASTGGGAATISGAETAINFLPGGRVQTDIGNFGLGQRVYGIDGVNRGWEFDGVTLAPISTGNVPDVPTAVLVHKEHLWFAFGDNLQNSGLTTPFNWTATAGSAAYRFDSDVTVLLRQPGDQSGGAMSVSTENSTSMLYGSSAANFQAVPFEESAGARMYGGQRLNEAVVFGNIGVYNLRATQAFGNFEPTSLTFNIRPFTQTRRNQCNASLVNKEKSQYRVFFNDGFGLYLTIVNRRLVGSMPVFFPNKAVVAWQGTSPDGAETSFFGSDNGFVYQLDSGTSADGAEIASFFTMAAVSEQSPRLLKRYRRATFECQGESYARFQVTYEVGYGAGDRPQGVAPVEGFVPLSSVYWDKFTWDNFTWDGKTLAPDTVEIAGTGENVALRIDCSSAKYSSFTINSIIIDYTPRRSMRS